MEVTLEKKQSLGVGRDDAGMKRSSGKPVKVVTCASPLGLPGDMCLGGKTSYLRVSFALRYEYKLAREYNWNVKNKASRGYEENYFFVFRSGRGVYYNELETRYCKPRSVGRLKSTRAPSTASFVELPRRRNSLLHASLCWNESDG